jgi:hypothetical protein
MEYPSIVGTIGIGPVRNLVHIFSNDGPRANERE